MLTTTAFFCMAVTAASVQLVTSSFPDQAEEEQCFVDQLFHVTAKLSRDLSEQTQNVTQLKERTKLQGEALQAIRNEMTMLRNETKNLKVTLQARIDELEAENKRLNVTVSSVEQRLALVQTAVDNMSETLSREFEETNRRLEVGETERKELHNVTETVQKNIVKLESDVTELAAAAKIPTIPDLVTSLRDGRCDADTFGQIYLDGRNNLLVLCDGSNWKTASVEDLSCVQLQPAPESCSQLYEANCTLYQQSGSYWLKGQTEGQYYRAYCDMRPGLGGWTLVGKADGNTSEWSPKSAYWYNSELIRPDTADDLTSTSAAKNEGWLTVKGSKLRVCYDGTFNSCAVFTHGLNVSLSELFLSRFGVPIAEGYTLQSLADAFNLRLPLFENRIFRQWCGLNHAGCDVSNSGNPNKGNHNTICRIGCIGDKQASPCRFDDFALGIGVSSCSDGHSCTGTGTSTPSLHYKDAGSSTDIRASFQQTAFIYVQ